METAQPRPTFRPFSPAFPEHAPTWHVAALTIALGAIGFALMVLSEMLGIGTASHRSPIIPRPSILGGGNYRVSDEVKVPIRITAANGVVAVDAHPPKPIPSALSGFTFKDDAANQVIALEFAKAFAETVSAR